MNKFLLTRSRALRRVSLYSNLSVFKLFELGHKCSKIGFVICLRVKKIWFCHLFGGFTVTAGSCEECGSLQLSGAIFVVFYNQVN